MENILPSDDGSGSTNELPATLDRNLVGAERDVQFSFC